MYMLEKWEQSENHVLALRLGKFAVPGKASALTGIGNLHHDP